MERKWTEIDCGSAAESDSDNRNILERFSHRILPIPQADDQLPNLLLFGGMDLNGIYNDCWLLESWNIPGKADDSLHESTVAYNATTSAIDDANKDI